MADPNLYSRIPNVIPPTPTIDDLMHQRQLYRFVYSKSEKMYTAAYIFNVERGFFEFPAFSPGRSVLLAKANNERLSKLSHAVGRIMGFRDVGDVDVYLSGFFIDKNYVISTSDWNIDWKVDWNKAFEDVDYRLKTSEKAKFVMTRETIGFWRPSDYEAQNYTELELVGFTKELALFRVIRGPKFIEPDIIISPSADLLLPSKEDIANLQNHPSFAITAIHYPGSLSYVAALEDYGNLESEKKGKIPVPTKDITKNLIEGIKSASPGYLEKIQATNFENVRMTCIVSYGSCGGPVVYTTGDRNEFVGIIVGGLNNFNSNLMLPVTSPQVAQLVKLMESDKQKCEKKIVVML